MGSGAGAPIFWPSLVAKNLDILIEQSLTLIKQSFTLIEQSSLLFLIANKCSGVNLVTVLTLILVE